jgi:hypothetical protein
VPRLECFSFRNGCNTHTVYSSLVIDINSDAISLLKKKSFLVATFVAAKVFISVSIFSLFYTSSTWPCSECDNFLIVVGINQN